MKKETASKQCVHLRLFVCRVFIYSFIQSLLICVKGESTVKQRQNNSTTLLDYLSTSPPNCGKLGCLYIHAQLIEVFSDLTSSKTSRYELLFSF